MNVALEIKKRQVEMMRVQAAKAEQELKIDEANEQIERLKNSMKIQDERVAQLMQEIKDLQSKL